MSMLGDRIRNYVARCRNFRRNERGNILVEFALVVPIFSVLAMGAYDMGRFAMETSRMEFAARAGAQVVLQDLSAIADLDSVRSEVIAAATVAAGPDVSDLVVIATRVCGCPDAGGTLVVGSCTTPCDDGNVAQTQLIVTTGHFVDPVFTIPGVIERKRIVGQFRVTVQ